MADALTRTQALEAAYNSGDLDKIMEYFADDLTFSDLVMGISNINKTQTREFYGGFLAKHKDVRFKTRSASGSDELMAWETDISFVAGGAIQALGIAEGEHVVFQGVVLMRWKGEKIVEEKDYFFLQSHK